MCIVRIFTQTKATCSRFCECMRDARCCDIATGAHSHTLQSSETANSQLFISQLFELILVENACLWNMSQSWFDVAMFVCVCHLGLASEALCNGKLLWKLRPKLHKFLDRSDPFWCYSTYTLIILFWVCQLGWTIYALMLLNVFAHFGPVVMAMKI